MHTKYGYYRQRTMDLTFTIRTKKIPRKFAVDATSLCKKNIIYAHDYYRKWKNFYFVWICKRSVRILYLSWIRIFSTPCCTRYQHLNKNTKIIFLVMCYFSNVIFILTGHYLLLAYQIQHEKGIAAFSICLFIGNIFQGLSI